MIYYIGDTHFGHENVIKLCQRPFETIEDHDRTLIENWNTRVKKNDTVYMLGDFSFRSKVDPKTILKKLKGNIHLIEGNHDTKLLNADIAYKEMFKSVSNILEVVDSGERVVLCHYPILEWKGYFKGWYHIYGHVHNKNENLSNKILRDMDKALNAGVDVNFFRPASLYELKSNKQLYQINNCL